MTPRPLRVAIFAPHFAEYATRLAIALADHATVLLILDEHNRINECDQRLMDEARERVKIIQFRHRGKFARQFWRLMVPLLTRLFRPDIVHVQEQPDPLTAAVVRLMGRSATMVLTVHDPNPHTGNDHAYATRMDRYRKFLRSRADAYHVHGTYCAKALAEAGWVGKPVSSTMHGVILSPAPAARLQAEPNRMLLFGRMEAYKGVSVAVAAADLLRREGASFRLVLAGRGPELERLRPVLAAHNDIEIIGHFLSPEEAVEQFQRAAFVILPYLDATQSGVVSAAFGNERPVVVTRTGGLPDAVQHGVDGIMVDPNSPEDLKDALKDLLASTEKQASLAKGVKAAAATRFAWPSIAADVVNFYRDVLKAPR